MVEQRSPKPSVACSSRVSPARKEDFYPLFFLIINILNIFCSICNLHFMECAFSLAKSAKSFIIYLVKCWSEI